MSALKKLLAASLAVGLTVVIAGLGRLPVTFAEADEAALRLSWRIQGASIEDCRAPTEEELAELPVHMRNPRACIGQIAPYLLSVRIDDEVLTQDTVFPAGARGDRPLTVLREVPLPVGSHRLTVDFAAILPEGAVVDEEGVTRLEWSGPVTLDSREVALVTLDGTGRTLELRRARQ